MLYYAKVEPAARTNNPVLRLETFFGGGKTHNLIALYHAARGQLPPSQNQHQGRHQGQPQRRACSPPRTRPPAQPTPPDPPPQPALADPPPQPALAEPAGAQPVLAEPSAAQLSLGWGVSGDGASQRPSR